MAGQTPMLTPDQLKRRRARSRAIALGLVIVVVLFYLLTLFKTGPAVMNRPL